MKKDFKIRKAKLEDINAISNLCKIMWVYHYKFDSYFKPSKSALINQKKFLKDGINSKQYSILVAEANNKIIGYSIGFIRDRAPVFSVRKMGLITDVFVLPKYRKQGLAQLFLKELFKWFKKNKIKYIELTVHIKNEIGIKAWEKHGFKTFMLKQVLKL